MTTTQESGLTERDLRDFEDDGFVVVRGLLESGEIETLRRRADDIATGRVAIPSGKLDGRGTGISRVAPRVRAEAEPGVRLTEQHERRGEKIVVVRQRSVDEATVAAAMATGDPFNDVSAINHICDYDEVFLSFASHPAIVAVLRQILAPNVKMIFDHIFCKGPYAGANRYHQDGFFYFTERSVTCWIALDEVTVENGCLRYLPERLGYGALDFDRLVETIGARELEQEVLVPLAPGDAVFHDRWVIHGTGPNETPRSRRGWALHFTNAKSRLGLGAAGELYEWDRTPGGGRHFAAHLQTPDGRHLRGDYVLGNRHYRLVCGREFPGCV